MKLFNTLIILQFVLTTTTSAWAYMDETGSGAPTTASQNQQPLDVTIPARYFERDGNVDRNSQREFFDLYRKFKDVPVLSDSKKALERVLAFYAKNKDGIPASCGGDMDSATSPRGESLDPVSRIDNQDYILLVDYTVQHTSDRFFVLDVKTGEVQSCPVAHGYGSNSNCPPEHQINCGNRGTKCSIASDVSNTSGSGATSRGFYLTDEGYRSSQDTFRQGQPRSTGTNALNLRGLLGGVNDNALARNVVFHRASYAENLCSSSAGCPAICPQLFEDYKDKVKRSLMYVHTAEDEEKDQPDC